MHTVSSKTHPGLFRALTANALFSGLSALTLLMAPAMVAGWLGSGQTGLLLVIGGGLLLFALRLGMLVRNGEAAVTEVWTIIAGDLGWVAGSALLILLALGRGTPTLSTAGIMLIGVIGTVVLLFALWQYRALKSVDTNLSAAGTHPHG